MNNWLDLVPSARHEYTPTRRLSVSWMLFHDLGKQFIVTQRPRPSNYSDRIALSEELGRYPSLGEAVTAMQELAVADRVAHALKGPETIQR